MELYSRLGYRSIPGLDGVRALAVLMVIGGHSGIVGVPAGHGVMAFFVLSGFLITWLLLQENERTGTVSWKNFYMRRALRIFPAFYVFGVIYLILAHFLRDRDSWIRFVTVFLYFSNYYEVIAKPDHMPMGHTWSLAVEEQFYLIWPWIFLRLKGNLNSLRTVLVGVICFIWAYRAWLCLALNASHNRLYLPLDTRFDQLAVGCLLAVLLKTRAWPRFFEAVCSNSFAPLITLGLLSVSIAYGMSVNPRYVYAYGFAIDSVLLAILLAQLISLTGRRAWSWVDHPVMRYVGRVSYGVYLYHWLVVFMLASRFGFLPLWFRFVIAVALSLALGSLSYYIVEMPFLRMKHRFSSHSKQEVESKAEIVARVTA